MTAQQQLAKLNATAGHWSDATESSAAGWVDKNGQAVAELIEADIALNRWHENQSIWMRGDGRVYQAERTVADDAKKKRAAALRKLTQDA